MDSMHLYKQPHQFKRRILLAVTGLSPQIVTETLYALAINSSHKVFIPTEIHIITTKEGKERAYLSLLSQQLGWFKRLCEDYQLPSIHFDENSIHVLNDPIEGHLNDIRSAKDNEIAADLITSKVAEFTADKDSALHVSIAGGRKTMGFYVGYALSLFGREQDRLSHVLVQPEYEGLRDFYYPTPKSNIIYTRPPESKPIDTQKAQLTLANIPFVRLRHGLPKTLLNGKMSFSSAVNAVQQGISQASVVIDLETQAIICSHQMIKLPPLELAFYFWMAVRKKQNKAALWWDFKEIREDFAQEYLFYYAQVLKKGKQAAYYQSKESIFKQQGGMDRNRFFDQTLSKVNKKLNKILGKTLAKKYHIISKIYPNTNYKVYEIDIEIENIHLPK